MDIKTININLFGSPGVGKSTLSTGLFHELKKKDILCEYITEYTKDLVYSEDFYRLKDQTYVLAKQHHPIFKLNGKLEYTINDEPFILGLLYVQEKDNFPIKESKDYLIKL